MKLRIYRPLASTNPSVDGANAETQAQSESLRHLNLKKLSSIGISLLSVVLSLTTFSNAALAQYLQRNLRPGDSGADVETLQYQLRQLGYFNGPFTGYYGELTENAVRQFQRNYGLDVDGIYGPETEGRLFSAIGIGGPGNGFPPDFPEDRSANYTVVVPGGIETRFKVQRIVPDAFLKSDGRGDFVQAGRYYSYSSAENLVNRLRRDGLDARVVYFR